MLALKRLRCHQQVPRLFFKTLEWFSRVLGVIGMPKKQPELLQPHVPAASKVTQAQATQQVKLAQRVEGVLMNQKVFQEPRQIDPRAILVAPSNRDGAPPNVPHVHHGIIKSIIEQGFDSTRPSVGICVEFKSPEAKQKLLEHNIRFTQART